MNSIINLAGETADGPPFKPGGMLLEIKSIFAPIANDAARSRARPAEFRKMCVTRDGLQFTRAGHHVFISDVELWKLAETHEPALLGPQRGKANRNRPS